MTRSHYLSIIKHLFFSVLCVFSFFQAASAKPNKTLQPDDIIGVWQSFDDKTGLKKGQVEFTYNKKTDSYIGRIIKVTPAPGYTPKEFCENCPKPFTGKKIEGLMVVWHLKPQKNGAKFSGKYDDGYLLDPVTGKVYRFQTKLSASKKALSVRGHIGVKMIGRNQTWMRIK